MERFVIEFYNGAREVGFPDASIIEFTVLKQASGVEFINGIKVFNAERANIISVETDINGVTSGTMQMTGMDEGFAAGDIFLLSYEDGTQAAFKSKTSIQPQGGILSVAFVKPDVTEVFEKLDYTETVALNGEAMIEIVDGIADELNGSELAKSIVSIFGSKPEFVPNVELVDDVLVVNVTIRIPNVVAIENFAATELVITLENAMKVNLNADIDIDTISEEFDISADITNDITATVSLGAGANLNKVSNVQELFQKLNELASESAEVPTAIPLFKWTLPIANGVASVSYDADLVFVFNFSGKIDLAAHANLDYTVGARYTEEGGIEMYSEEGENNGFDTLELSLQGMAELKVGVDQEISFDILAGVLGIGLQAELGNYNRVYGYAETTNLINDEEDALNGGVYFVGGFYYDVNLTYGLKVGSLLNVSDKADIAAGEVQLYEAGERYVAVGLRQTNDTVTLTAKQSLVPSIYEAEMFDLVTQAVSYEAVDASELVFGAAEGLTFVGNVVNVNEGIDEVNSRVTVKYQDFDSVTTIYIFSAEKPMLDVDNESVDKNTEFDDPVVTITYAGIADGMISISENVAAAAKIAVGDGEATVTLKGKELLKLASGVHEVVFTVDGYELVYTLEITGEVKVDQFRNEQGMYEIFTADQVKALANGGTYEGKTLYLSSDIDLGGAVIAPIAEFKGKILGYNHTVSGFVVNGMSDNNAAFIAVNSGSVRDLNLEGSVAVAFDGKTNNDYKVAGLAAVNNGTISNVAVKGSVDVASNSLSAFIDIDAAMVAAVNNGTIEDATAEGVVNVTVAFDLANVTVNAGGITSTEAADGVEASIDCVNGRSNPIFTKANIAE